MVLPLAHHGAYELVAIVGTHALLVHEGVGVGTGRHGVNLFVARFVAYGNDAVQAKYFPGDFLVANVQVWPLANRRLVDVD